MDLIALADFAAGIVIISYSGQILTFKKHFHLYGTLSLHAVESL
jgi:hypothetical protein